MIYLFVCCVYVTYVRTKHWFEVRRTKHLHWPMCRHYPENSSDKDKYVNYYLYIAKAVHSFTILESNRVLNIQAGTTSFYAQIMAAAQCHNAENDGITIFSVEKASANVPTVTTNTPPPQPNNTLQVSPQIPVACCLLNNNKLPPQPNNSVQQSQPNQNMLPLHTTLPITPVFPTPDDTALDVLLNDLPDDLG